MHSVAITKPGRTAAVSAVLVLVVPFSWQSAGRAGAQDRATTRGAKRDDQVVVTVVFDNYRFREGMETAWGFACVIEGLGPTILFDTGGDGKLLLANLAEAGFRPVRLIGVSVSQLQPRAGSQMELFTDEQKQRRRDLDRATDEIQSRFGRGSIHRGIPYTDESS